MLNFILELTEDILSKTSKLSQKDKDFVYDQVSFALKQTKAHISSTRKKNTDKASTILSNIWQRTGNQIKKIKHVEVQNLAQIMEEKSKYWSDPDNYDKKLFEKYQIKISQVESTLDKLCK